jgi:hypothetical protein
LRHKKLVALHKKIKSLVEIKIGNFETIKDYRPPYWKLVDFARESIKENKLL